MNSVVGMPAKIGKSSTYVILRQILTVALVIVIAGVVWLPHMPSVLAAAITAMLVIVLVIGLTQEQDSWFFSSASVFAVLFIILRLLALWDEPPALGGIDSIVSLLVSLAIFLSMAVPRWSRDLAQRAMAYLSLAGSAAAGTFWWLSRGYTAVLGSVGIGVEFSAQGINRNDFGFVVAVATVLAFMFTRLHQGRSVERLLWAVVGVFDLAFLAALGSRTSLALALIGVVVDLVLERPSHAWWIAGASITLVALVPQWWAWIMRMGYAVPETIKRGAALVQALTTGNASQIAIASAGRTTIWQAGLAAFARSPMWGIGPDGLRSAVLQSTGSYLYAHSTLITLLAESGLVSTIFFYASFLVVVVQLSYVMRHYHGAEWHMAAALEACTIAILLVSPFATTGLDKVAYTLLGLGVSLGSQHDRTASFHGTSKRSRSKPGLRLQQGSS